MQSVHRANANYYFYSFSIYIKIISHLLSFRFPPLEPFNGNTPRFYIDARHNSRVNPTWKINISMRQIKTQGKNMMATWHHSKWLDNKTARQNVADGTITTYYTNIAALPFYEDKKPGDWRRESFGSRQNVNKWNPRQIPAMKWLTGNFTWPNPDLRNKGVCFG